MRVCSERDRLLSSVLSGALFISMPPGAPASREATEATGNVCESGIHEGLEMSPAHCDTVHSAHLSGLEYDPHFLFQFKLTANACDRTMIMSSPTPTKLLFCWFLAFKLKGTLKQNTYEYNIQVL